MLRVRDGAAALLLPLLLGAADAPAAPDYAADARSIERLVDEDYAYLERFDGARMPMSDKLRAEAESVASRDALIRFAERALTALADHHAITGSSLADSWALVPSYSDLWIEPDGAGFAITAVREGSPAEKAGVRAGDSLVAVGTMPVAQAIEAFWADLGLPVTPERAGYAARVLAAGRRDAPRQLTVAREGARRDLVLPNLYTVQPHDRELVTVVIYHAETRRPAATERMILINDSLGDSATIAAFDEAMTQARPEERLVIDLTDTASGGNTSVARAIMGWFVDRPTSYQLHTLPAEERQTGIPRQWIEQVLPRPGKHHDGPVTVRVGRWTGSMGEGLAIGFDAIGARVEGGPMAGLLGAVYDYTLEQSGLVIKFPVERLFHVDGTPREAFVPQPGASGTVSRADRLGIR
jgi:carboxyl-terminal processing protease